MRRTFSYNKSIRVETRREKLTGDAGALLSREVLECSGVIPVLAKKLGDPRVPGKIKHSIENLLRAVFLLAAQGRRDHNDADLFRDDPAFRLAVSGRGGTAPLNGRGLPSQPTLSRLAALLAEPGHTEALREMPFRLAAWRMLALDGRLPATLTLDIDSLPVEVHGRQPGSRWNRYYKARIFHPLAASVARTGDLLDLRLREGDVHTAEGGLEYILEVVALARRFLCPNITVRFDAGFPGARLLAGLEEQNIPYIARVQTNAVLKRRGEPAVDAVVEDAWLGREPGAKPRTFVKELESPVPSGVLARLPAGRAGDCRTARQVVSPNLLAADLVFRRRSSGFRASSSLPQAGQGRRPLRRVYERGQSFAAVVAAAQEPLPRQTRAGCRPDHRRGRVCPQSSPPACRRGRIPDHALPAEVSRACNPPGLEFARVAGARTAGPGPVCRLRAARHDGPQHRRAPVGDHLPEALQPLGSLSAPASLPALTALLSSRSVSPAVLRVSAGVSLDSDPGPVVRGVAQPVVSGKPTEDDLGLSGAPGNGSNAAETAKSTGGHGA